MKKNKKYTIAIIISLFISGLAVFAYQYKEEIRVFLELKELKNDGKYYYITNDKKKIEITIPNNANIDDILALLQEKGELKGETQFKDLADVKRYTNNIIYGTIILEGKYSINSLINALKFKKKETINFQIPENIRLIDSMIVFIENNLGYKRGDLKNYLDNSDFLQSRKLTMETLPAFFIPNTYELYADISIEDFLNKMDVEYKKFWNKDRIRKQDSLKLSKIEVSILASIVEEEMKKKNNSERRRIAGLYINRLNNPQDYPYLQADPTVKFACNDFSIKQVLDIHTEIIHPYNTYPPNGIQGLPPGPICIPSIHAIDAVLNSEDHEYTFMCAGSDGLHKFTSNNNDHNKHKKRFKKSQGFK